MSVEGLLRTSENQGRQKTLHTAKANDIAWRRIVRFVVAALLVRVGDCSFPKPRLTPWFMPKKLDQGIHILQRVLNRSSSHTCHTNSRRVRKCQQNSNSCTLAKVAGHSHQRRSAFNIQQARETTVEGFLIQWDSSSTTRRHSYERRPDPVEPVRLEASSSPWTVPSTRESFKMSS